MACATISLPTPELALDQHRYGGTRGPLSQADDARHFGAPGDKILKGKEALRAARGAAHLAGERVGRKRILDRNLQTFRPNGLHDEIRSAGAHRRDDGLDRTMRRLHDDGRLQLLVPHSRKNAHAVEIGHDEVENEQRDRRRIRRREASQR